MILYLNLQYNSMEMGYHKRIRSKFLLIIIVALNFSLQLKLSVGRKTVWQILTMISGSDDTNCSEKRLFGNKWHSQPYNVHIMSPTLYTK